MTANGVCQRVAGVEAAEQIGRGERHGTILKENFNHVCLSTEVIGKDMVKKALAVGVAMKNEMIRYGGIAPAQWVLGRFPRDLARLLEEDEFGQLGVLCDHLDSTTEFGLRAKFRLASVTAFVRQACGRRYMRAMSSNSGPIL